MPDDQQTWKTFLIDLQVKGITCTWIHINKFYVQGSETAPLDYRKLTNHHFLVSSLHFSNKILELKKKCWHWTMNQISFDIDERKIRAILLLIDVIDAWMRSVIE